MEPMDGFVLDILTSDAPLQAEEAGEGLLLWVGETLTPTSMPSLPEDDEDDDPWW